MRGTIRLLKLGYGFIHGADGTDYFFHRTGLEMTTWKFDDLKTSIEVVFTAIQAPKGPRAIEIRVVDQAVTAAPEG
jgi:cold shock CspA family protein